MCSLISFFFRFLVRFIFEGLGGGEKGVGVVIVYLLEVVRLEEFVVI